MAGYLGNAPTAVPLSSADLQDNIITSAKIADGTIVNADINASAGIVQSKLSGSFGITEADTWRLTTTITGSDTTLTNLERDDTSGFGYLGTGMTQTSGTFTFPTTGIYLIIAIGTWEVTNENIAGLEIQTTINNSSYTTRSQSFVSSGQTSHHKSSIGTCFFDVTSTTNCKVKFLTVSMNASVSLLGTSGFNYTTLQFIRLGDT